MRRLSVTLAALALLAGSLSFAHEDVKLPPGPIHDRHELMEDIGANAKKIGDALKVKDMKTIAAAAEKIAADAKKIPALFPPGSTSPQSRAKAEIWKDWAAFEKSAAELTTTADAVAKAAQSGGDAGAAAKTMFGNCKSCHDAFREPEKD